MDAGVALSFYIGVILAALALLLLVGARARPNARLLALYLGLVSFNFLAWGVPQTETSKPQLVWGASLVLAWDPLVLVAFTTAYPYHRRTRGVHALMALLGLGAMAASVVLLADPGRSMHWGGGRATELVDPVFWTMIAMLVVGYTSAWLLALRTAREAPTPQLARRAGWLVAAVGVAVVPRLALTPLDGRIADHFSDAWGLGRWSAESLEFALGAAIAMAVLALGARELRGGTARDPRGLARSTRVVVIATAAVLVMWLVVGVANVTAGLGIGWGVITSLRWLFFAPILVYAVLSHELVDLRRASERVLPPAGAMAAAFGAFLAVVVVVRDPPGGGTATLSYATAIALGASVPGAAIARAVARRLTHVVGAWHPADHRLALYRATLESAWVSGTPNARAREQLERDRRAFGVSPEEARALEHVVAAQLSPGRRPLAPGDEAAPGVVVERLLGEGAHGRVLLARREPAGTPVVVKELHGLDGTGSSGPSFVSELRALERLEHPHIVRLLEARVDGGRRLLVMEHVDGESLSERLRRGPPDEAEVHRWAGQLLDALAEAHGRGIVHRDVKPANILIDRRGAAHLTDFGTALTLEGEGGVRATVTTLVGREAIVGTLAYMAPEQARGRQATAASDLYALGLVVYECLTGRPALDLRGHGLYDALEAAANPRLDLEEVPPTWRAFVERALAVEPGERAGSVTELLAALPARLRTSR